MMGPFTFGKAIDIINSSPNKLVMMRKGWHGIETGKDMYVGLRSMLFFRQDDNNPMIGTPDKGDTSMVYVFYVNGIGYAWNISQNDMMNNDWYVIEKAP